MPHMARLDPFASPPASKMVAMERLLLDSSPDFGWQNGTQKFRPIGDMTPPSMPHVLPQTSYRERSQRLRQLDKDRNSLIDDLIRQLESSQQQLTQLRVDHDRESRFNREGQLREESLHAELAQIKSLIERDPYLTVLIDAEVAIFSKDLWRKGEQGATEVVQTLSKHIHDFATQKLTHLNSPKIQIRIFADLRTLSETLLANGVIDNQSMFDGFVRGVNMHLSVDFVDTGSYPQFAKRKLAENYHQQIRNCHCHQIFLAISANEEYESIFDCSSDVQLSERVTLLDSTSRKAIDASRHNIGSLKIDNLFQDATLDTTRTPSIRSIGSYPLTRVGSNLSANTLASGSASSTPGLSWAAMTAQPFIPSALNTSTSRTSTPASRNSPSPKGSAELQRNKFGQRIDTVDNSIPYQELQRIKKMKLCNIYYLQGPSSCNGNCGHSHSYPLKSHEKSILREVARMTPCYYKLDCSDPSCIYGHRCPQSKPGQDSCYYEDKCRFIGWGHGIDDKIVRTTSIKG